MPPTSRLPPQSFRLPPQSFRLTVPPHRTIRTTTSSSSPFSPSSSSSPSPSSPSIPNNWRLSSSGAAIEKSFKFKNFTQAWGFMSKVAERSEMVGHHPEWWNVYNKVTIKWTTHSARALTEKDTDMARACDEFAEEMEMGKNP